MLPISTCPPWPDVLGGLPWRDVGRLAAPTASNLTTMGNALLLPPLPAAESSVLTDSTPAAHVRAPQLCGLLPSPFRPDPRSMAAPRWSLQRGWHELGAQVVVISSLSVMTGCYHLVRINVVCYDRAPIPILGLDAAAGGGQSGKARVSPK